MRENPRNVGRLQKVRAFARRSAATARRRAIASAVYRSCLSAFYCPSAPSAIGIWATLMGHPSQDGAAVKQVTFTPDGKQEHLGNS